MRKKELTIKYNFYENLSELNELDIELLESAKAVSKDAYAPYSEFKVGACVRLNNSEKVLGTNQENAAYPSGLCAERVAFFAAFTNFPKSTADTIAIYAANSEKSGDEISPCGACRQVLSEYEQKQEGNIRILLMSNKLEVYEFFSVESLLPFSFNLANLKNKG